MLSIFLSAPAIKFSPASLILFFKLSFMLFWFFLSRKTPNPVLSNSEPIALSPLLSNGNTALNMLPKNPKPR
jgi:hypothetical protein